MPCLIHARSLSPPSSSWPASPSLSGLVPRLYKPTTFLRLLEVFWRQIDPTDAGGQFIDRGNSYVSGIFVNSEAQRNAAQRSKDALIASERFDSEIVTPKPTPKSHGFHSPTVRRPSISDCLLLR
ncbi:MAG: peptide-methionine (S)-S-oxide reductase [Planctomycetota bacterium]